MSGLIGKKIGMTQVYTGEGNLIGVSVVEAGPCPILAIKEKSVQLAFEPIKEKRAKKPVLGLFKKAGVSARRVIREFAKEEGKEYQIGQEIKVDMFTAGDFVDVTGVTIGKGFQGGMKRWHWKGGKETHGSTSHRRPGSIGSTTTPGRVIKGHHMPGHMGAANFTVQNLRIEKIDLENNLIVLKGAIPGHKNGYVFLKKATKKLAKARVALLKPKIMPKASAKKAAKK